MFTRAWHGNDAVLSECGRYRYHLTRRLTPPDLGHFGCDGRYRYPRQRIANFIMLNPSTADANKDDATIRRCMGFARKWGCDQLEVTNLFAFRATRPFDMLVAEDPVGPKNEFHILDAAQWAEVTDGLVVAAWGIHGAHRSQDHQVMRLLLKTHGVRVKCLGVTADGFPRHPLYLRADVQPQDFTGLY